MILATITDLIARGVARRHPVTGRLVWRDPIPTREEQQETLRAAASAKAGKDD